MVSLAARLAGAALLALVALPHLATADFYSAKSGVVNADAKTFNKLIKSDGVVLMEFYAPWCGHCQKLKPEWVKTAKALKGIATVAALDAAEKSNGPIAQRYGVRGYPTIKAFVKGKKAPVDYNGARDGASMAKWAESLVPFAGVNLTPKTADGFFSSAASTPKAVLFGDRGSTPAYWKAVANTLADDGALRFGEVLKRHQAVAAKFNVRKFPTVMFFGADGADPVAYTGQMDAKPLGKWLARQANLEGADASAVVELKDQSCLEAHCGASARGSSLCVLLLTSNDVSESQRALEVLDNIEGAQDADLFTFVWANGSLAEQRAWATEAFGELSAEWSQVVLFSPKKLAFANYIGAFTEGKIARFVKDATRGKVRTVPMPVKAMPALPAGTSHCKAALEAKTQKKKERTKRAEKKGGDEKKQKAKKPASGPDMVIHATDDSFANDVLASPVPALVEFYAPWCGHCQKLAPDWAKASRHMKGMVRFVAVDATVHKALGAKYKIEGFPTIKMYIPGESELVDYQGPRSAGGLSKTAMQLLDQAATQHASLATIRTSDRLAQFLGSVDAGAAKFLYVTESKKTPSLLKALALLHSNVGAGAVTSYDPETFASVGFELPTLPALLYFGAKASEPDVDTDSSLQGALFPGDLRNFAEISAWAAEVAGDAPAGGSGSGAAAAQQEEELVEVPELRSQADFEAQCVQKPNICGIVALDADAAAQVDAGSSAYMEWMQSIAQRNAKAPFRLVWLRRAEQPQWAKAFSLADGEALTMVAMNAKKRVYATFVGAPTEENVEAFLKELVAGKRKVARAKNMPELNTVAAAAAAADDAEAPSCGGGAADDAGEDEGLCTAPPTGSAKDEL